MSLFSIVQGVTPPLPPAPEPPPMTMPLPPMAPPAPAPQVAPPMYNLPARADGGHVNLGDGSTSFVPNRTIQNDGNWGQRPGYDNLPGFHEGGTANLDHEGMTAAAYQAHRAGGGGGGDTTSLSPWQETWYRANYDGTATREKIAVIMSDPQMAAAAQADFDDKYGPESGSRGGGADNSLGYAQLAQQAQQWAAERADQHAENIQANKIAQQQASQEYYANLERENTDRRQQGINAGTAAMDAFTANVGKSYVPGWENYNPFNGDAMPTMPTFNLDPSKAVGKNLPQANIPAPVIPDLVYGGQ